jgi:hypothetical protein
MSPRLFQSDAAGLASLCHQKSLRRHSSLALQRAALLPHHPQLRPQQQMLPEKPCALYRQFARPFVQTLTAS